jgi:hypothetical protein
MCSARSVMSGALKPSTSKTYASSRTLRARAARTGRLAGVDTAPRRRCRSASTACRNVRRRDRLVQRRRRTCHSPRLVPTSRPFSFGAIQRIAFTSSAFSVNDTALSRPPCRRCRSARSSCSCRSSIRRDAAGRARAGEEQPVVVERAARREAGRVGVDPEAPVRLRVRVRQRRQNRDVTTVVLVQPVMTA